MNLPIVPVTDLTIKNNDLVASTQGRAFWVLDDLSVLEQAQGPISTTLYKPRDVHRPTRRGIRVGGPAGQNQSTDALINYSFASKQSAAKLEFLDQAVIGQRAFPGQENRRRLDSGYWNPYKVWERGNRRIVLAVDPGAPIPLPGAHTRLLVIARSSLAPRIII